MAFWRTAAAAPASSSWDSTDPPLSPGVRVAGPADDPRPLGRGVERREERWRVPRCR